MYPKRFFQKLNNKSCDQFSPDNLRILLDNQFIEGSRRKNFLEKIKNSSNFLLYIFT